MVVSRVWSDLCGRRWGHRLAGRKAELAALTKACRVRVFHDWVCLLVVGTSIRHDVQRICRAAFGISSVPVFRYRRASRQLPSHAVPRTSARMLLGAVTHLLLFGF